MKQKSNLFIFLLIVAIGALLYYGYSNRQQAPGDDNKKKAQKEVPQGSGSGIDELTRETIVVPYVKKNGRLPEYYLTKKQARENGWVAADGNLCEVLPGKAIGGDIFSNREGSLPRKKDRTWYEADLNYNCGRRNADRLVFSNDGLLFVTHDHYKTFREQ